MVSFETIKFIWKLICHGHSLETVSLSNIQALPQIHNLRQHVVITSVDYFWTASNGNLISNILAASSQCIRKGTARLSRNFSLASAWNPGWGAGKRTLPSLQLSNMHYQGILNDFELTSFFSGCISYYTRLFMFQQHNPFIKLEASMLPYATAPHIKETQRSGVFETAAGWNSLSKYHITLNSCFMIVCDEYIDHICQTSRSFS